MADRPVRQTLQSNPTNLANLLSNLSHHLFTLLPSPLFPGGSSSASSQDPTRELLNCLRVLGRIIVVIYESEADARDKHIWLEETFAWKWLWRRMKIGEVKERSYEMGEELDGDEVGAETSGVDESGQFTIADEDESDHEEEEGDEGAKAFKAVAGNPPTPATSEVNGAQDPLQAKSDDKNESENGSDRGQAQDDTIPCLIDRLFSCTIDLLFCASFTVPESVKGQSIDGDKINVGYPSWSTVSLANMQYVIWEKGVGSTVNVGSSADLDRNKTEVLRMSCLACQVTS